MAGAANDAQFGGPSVSPPRLDDLQRRITGSQYGTAIPQVWGLCRVGGSVIWGQDLDEHDRIGESPAGIAWGMSGDYYYTANLAVAVCRGPITRIRRIWAGDQVIYDYTESPESDYTIRIYLGTEVQTADSLISTAEGAANTPAYRGLAYVVFEDLPLDRWGNVIPNFSFEVEEGAATVGGILGDIADQVGLAAGDRDFTAATAAVTGCLREGRVAAREAISSLLQVYGVDLAEIDDQVVAVPRGGASLASIDADDLGAHVYQEGGEPVPPAQTTRSQELDLPGRVDLTYLTDSETYDRRVQTAYRHGYTAQVQDPWTITVPIVMTADLARQTAERILYDAWNERQRISLRLPPRWWTVPPAGVITVPIAGTNTRMRVRSADIGLFGEVRAEAAFESADTLTQGASGGEPPYTPPALTSPVPTVFTAWSGPEQADEDGLLPGFYVAGYGADGWTGATIYYSPDGGTSWVIGGALQYPSIWGTTVGALADWADPSSWDNTNTVDVTVGGGVPGSVSQTEVLNGRNYALIGNEQGGFATVADLGGGTYRLSVLRRGRRSTAMTGHAPGDRFVVVTSAVARVSVDASLVGQVVPVKVVSYGQALGDVTAVNVTIAGNNYPYAPANDQVLWGPFYVGPLVAGLRYNLRLAFEDPDTHAALGAYPDRNFAQAWYCDQADVEINPETNGQTTTSASATAEIHSDDASAGSYGDEYNLEVWCITEGPGWTGDSDELIGTLTVDPIPALVPDHGDLTGLGDDDHTQYHNDARALTWHSSLSGAHVTNGDSHDHAGGDGAQVDHGGLGGLGDDDHTQYVRHSLATAVSDFLVASGAGAWVKKTLAEVKTILGLGSAAYTASTDYAPAAQGVTNGDSHDHAGGDGAQVDHGGLAGLGDDDHTAYAKVAGRASESQTVQGDLAVNGYTAHGSGNTATMRKVLSLTTAAAEGGYTSVAHGVTSTKIVGVTAIVFWDTGKAILPGYDTEAGVEYSVNFDLTNVTVVLSAANSESILSKAAKIVVEYTA